MSFNSAQEHNEQVYNFLFKISIPWANQMGYEYGYEITSENLSKLPELSMATSSSPFFSEVLCQSQNHNHPPNHNNHNNHNSHSHNYNHNHNENNSENSNQNSYVVVNARLGYNRNIQENEDNLDMTQGFQFSFNQSIPRYETSIQRTLSTTSSMDEPFSPASSPLSVQLSPKSFGSTTTTTHEIIEDSVFFNELKQDLGLNCARHKSKSLKSEVHSFTIENNLDSKIKVEPETSKPFIVEPPKAKISKRKKKVLSKERECSNCGATQTPIWRQTLEKKIVCNACGLYFKQHNKPRPMKCKNSNEGLSCSHCKMNKTPAWRRDKNGLLLCNACGLYLKLHNIRRPLGKLKEPKTCT